MNVEAGSFTDSEIIVMLGENGTGKTTFIRMLAGACDKAGVPLCLRRTRAAARTRGAQPPFALQTLSYLHKRTRPTRAGMLPPDDSPDGEELPQYNVSYKPQKISPKFEGSVRQLLHKKIRDSYLHPQVGAGAGVGFGRRSFFLLVRVLRA
jgi:ATP-binding cassette subfamily E protein 1